MPKLNVELLERVITFIKDNPEKHDQRKWCGTAQCLAGWTVALSPEVVAVDTAWEVATTADGQTGHVGDVAAKLLGLPLASHVYYTFEGTKGIFATRNTLDDIERIAKDLINESKLIDG